MRSLTGPDFDHIAKALQAYEGACLPVSTSKSFGFAKDLGKAVADTHFTAWGTEVDSTTGLVGADARKRALLTFVGLKVVSTGMITGSCLRWLVS